MPISAFKLLNGSDNSEMGRIEVCMEESASSNSPKDDCRQSDSDTEQQHRNKNNNNNGCSNSSDVEELRAQLRERDEQMKALKDDKTVCMKQILDLKDQLYQLVSIYRLDVHAMDCMHNIVTNIYLLHSTLPSLAAI